MKESVKSFNSLVTGFITETHKFYPATFEKFPAVVKRTKLGKLISTVIFTDLSLLRIDWSNKGLRWRWYQIFDKIESMAYFNKFIEEIHLPRNLFDDRFEAIPLTCNHQWQEKRELQSLSGEDFDNRFSPTNDTPTLIAGKGVYRVYKVHKNCPIFILSHIIDLDYSEVMTFDAIYQLTKNIKMLD